MAEMQVLPVMMVMPVTMPVAMPVTMCVLMPMLMPVGMALDRRVAASANRAHQTASRSLIRISSPPFGISRPPPQSGQGASLSSISTSCPQS